MEYRMEIRVFSHEFLPLKERILQTYFEGNPSFTRHKPHGVFEYATFESDIKSDVLRVFEMLPPHAGTAPNFPLPLTNQTCRVFPAYLKSGHLPLQAND